MPSFTLKNALFLAVFVPFVLMVFITEEWQKAHLPWFYAIRWAVIGVAIGVGALFNILPGQVYTGEKPSGLETVLTLGGGAAFMYLFFNVAETIKLNYPAWFVPFRIFVVSAITFAWFRTQKYRS